MYYAARDAISVFLGGEAKISLAAQCSFYENNRYITLDTLAKVMTK